MWILDRACMGAALMAGLGAAEAVRSQEALHVERDVAGHVWERVALGIRTDGPWLAHERWRLAQALMLGRHSPSTVLKEFWGWWGFGSGGASGDASSVSLGRVLEEGVPFGIAATNTWTGAEKRSVRDRLNDPAFPVVGIGPERIIGIGANDLSPGAVGGYPSIVRDGGALHEQAFYVATCRHRSFLIARTGGTRFSGRLALKNRVPGTVCLLHGATDETEPLSRAARLAMFRYWSRVLEESGEDVAYKAVAEGAEEIGVDPAVALVALAASMGVVRVGLSQFRGGQDVSGLGVEIVDVDGGLVLRQGSNVFGVPDGT